jgi:hypothetical protein
MIRRAKSSTSLWRESWAVDGCGAVTGPHPPLPSHRSPDYSATTAAISGYWYRTAWIFGSVIFVLSYQ